MSDCPSASEWNDTDAVIDVRHLTKKFGSRTVVNNIDLRVARGRIYGFLGPNGSGKTTTIRMLCGLLTPTSGEGTCLGFDIMKDAPLIRKQVGYMTQKFSFWEDMTIRENLEFTANIYEMENAKSLVDATLDRLRLTTRANQAAGTLSGGWKQRLALAACILHKPSVLLLDEPTAGVDPKARREFWDELGRLSDEGMTILVSTHYMDEAERCHELVYIAYGDLMVKGTVADVIAGAGLKTLTVAGKNLPALQKRLEQSPDVNALSLFGGTLRICGQNEERLIDLLRPFAETNALSWQKADTYLEDAFIYYLKKAREN